MRMRQAGRAPLAPQPFVVPMEAYNYFLEASKRGPPIVLSVRTERSATGEDFRDLDQAMIRRATADALSALLLIEAGPDAAVTEQPILAHQVRVRRQDCKADIHGCIQVAFYSIGVTCTQDQASVLSRRISSAGGVFMDWGRSARIRATLCPSSDPINGQHVVGIHVGAWAPFDMHGLERLFTVGGGSVVWIAEVEPATKTTPATILHVHAGPAWSAMSDAPPVPDLSWLTPRRHDHLRTFIALLSGAHELVRSAGRPSGIVIQGPAATCGPLQNMRVNMHRLPAVVPPLLTPPKSKEPAGSYAAALARDTPRLLVHQPQVVPLLPGVQSTVEPPPPGVDVEDSSLGQEVVTGAEPGSVAAGEATTIGMLPVRAPGVAEGGGEHQGEEPGDGQGAALVSEGRMLPGAMAAVSAGDLVQHVGVTGAEAVAGSASAASVDTPMVDRLRLAGAKRRPPEGAPEPGTERALGRVEPRLTETDSQCHPHGPPWIIISARLGKGIKPALSRMERTQVRSLYGAG